MKKSILALSAAAALGGLGFAGSAHAIAYFGNGASLTANAAATELAAGNIGHFLFTPYYSVQGNMNTLLNIANTDMTNGKAVKVRFRGAANSDDVLDFTVFLSPGDVWTASLTQGADGRAQITTPDTSCTLPPQTDWPGHFSSQRLANYLSPEAKDAHTREGYVEVLNMADIPPTLLSDPVAGTVGPTAGLAKGKANPVYTAIKHVAGKAPCTTGAFDGLLEGRLVTAAAEAEGYGLAVPSGGLMGSWAVLSQNQLAVYGGAQTAVMATLNPGANAAGAPTGAPLNTTAQARGQIAFAPQLNAGLDAAAQTNIGKYTADPLLASGKVQALWFDLPDMSTPLFGTDPKAQADKLSVQLSKPAIYNDYIASSGVVPMETDWVVSQPTRRYHAVVDYGTSATASTILWNADMTTPYATNPPAATDFVTTAPTAANNRYSVLTKKDVEVMGQVMGPYACLTAGFAAADREEKFTSAGSSFSPGVTSPYCGEVFTVSFNSPTSKVLQAKVANSPAAAPGQAGWAKLTLGGGTTTYLPVVGFAATSMKNTRADGSGGNYGMTINHRW